LSTAAAVHNLSVIERFAFFCIHTSVIVSTELL
jgi:hypothetical protein